MIIVEGPDGAGKTTLIQGLAEYLDMPVAEKAVSPEMGAMTDMRDYIEKALTDGFQPVIYDRFALISGPIYGPVFSLDGTVNAHLKDFDWLLHMQTRLLYEIEPVIIWCLPPLKNVMHNLTFGSVKQPASFTPEKVRQIYWLYHCRAAMDPNPIVWDYTSGDVGHIYDLIDEELEGRDA